MANPGRPPGKGAKIEKYGPEVAGRIDRVLLKGGTLQEACETFESLTGETIHPMTMSKRNQRIRQAAKNTLHLERLVSRIMKARFGDAESSSEELADFARRLLLAQAADAVAGITPNAMEALTPDQLVRTVATLERSRIDADRLRLQFTKGFETAKRAILAKMAEDLRDHPDLLDAVREVADRAAAEEEARAGVLELDERGRPIVAREAGEAG